MVSKIANYTSASEIQRWWLESIAPNYFDFEDVNLYRCGIFGYINEICSTVTEDGWNGISIARREFYPALAQYKQSLYKMATVQDIPLPMVVPAAVDCILIIPEKDIIEKGSQTGDTITYILDDTLTAPIGNYTFMLDYPVIILARETGGEYSYTTHYDKTYVNSISTIQNKYVYHKRIKKNGEYLLLIKVRMSQVELTPDEATVSRTSIIDTYTVDFNFSGDLANFEVFYKENDNARVIQLKKQVDGSPVINEPFCNYKFLSDNTLRLIFPFNTKFIPAYNSYISIRIYTSSGSKATFKVYKDDFSCTTNSEKYPYNNETIILGVVEGSTINGFDKPDMEAFRQQIINAFSTNQTIITKNDLQILFNERNNNDKNHISFEQSRDDAFSRTYGAYMLLKDSNNMVVPSNTLDVIMTKEDFDVSYPAAKRYIIRPGKLFSYNDSKIIEKNSLKDINIDSIPYSEMKLSENLDKYEYGNNELFFYTNPFLISVTTDPNAVGYYLNSIYKSIPIDFSYVNDSSLTQFIATNLSIKRNAILGEDCYTLSLIVSPSTDNIDVSELYSDSGLTEIRAAKSGMIKSITFDTEKNALFANVEYDDNTSTTIQCCTTITPDRNYKPQIGYKLQYDIYERFEAGNIIATPYVADLQKIKIFLQLNTSNDSIDYNIPFALEEINENGNLVYRAYIPTDDFISLDSTTRIIGNVFDSISTNPKAITSPINGIKPYICIFFDNDGNNIINSYSNWPYVKGLTLTNIYELTNDETLDFIYQINFMNSVLTFEETDTEGIFNMRIKQVPLVKANWVKSENNASYLIDNIYDNYYFIKNIFYRLEESFSIDLKFFNSYGKSRNYYVGIKNSSNILDKVNCSLSFGIKLSITADEENFKNEFTVFIRKYIESLNATSSDNSLYILNMLSDAKSQFSEIEYIEYYGMNNYGTDVQKIESIPKSDLLAAGIKNQVPEFININSIIEDGIKKPKIDILFL